MDALEAIGIIQKELNERMCDLIEQRDGAVFDHDYQNAHEYGLMEETLESIIDWVEWFERMVKEDRWKSLNQS